MMACRRAGILFLAVALSPVAACSGSSETTPSDVLSACMAQRGFVAEPLTEEGAVPLEWQHAYGECLTEIGQSLQALTRAHDQVSEVSLELLMRHGFLACLDESGISATFTDDASSRVEFRSEQPMSSQELADHVDRCLIASRNAADDG